MVDNRRRRRLRVALGGHARCAAVVWAALALAGAVGVGVALAHAVGAATSERRAHTHLRACRETTDLRELLSKVQS